MFIDSVIVIGYYSKKLLCSPLTSAVALTSALHWAQIALVGCKSKSSFLIQYINPKSLVFNQINTVLSTTVFFACLGK